jgi:hypothetical protein
MSEGVVQQGLCVRPGDHLLAPKGLQAAGPPALPEVDGAPRQGESKYVRVWVWC